jgi:hypothetical protein
MAQKSSRLPKEEVVLEDPIFGLSYNPSVVRYEEVPPWLDKKCKLGASSDDRMWIYAHVGNKDSELYIVINEAAGKEGYPGSALWVKGAECETDGSDWTLSGKLPERGYGASRSWEGLPGFGAPRVCEDQPSGSSCRYILRSPVEEAVLRSLVKDGIQRAVKAFGKAQFSKMECSAQAISEQSDYPIVQQELRKFCSTPN